MSGGPKERRRGNAQPTQYEAVFRPKTVLTWDDFWERMSEATGQSSASFQLQHGHLLALVRYLIQCEGNAPGQLNPPQDLVKLEELNAFAAYFPSPKTVMDDISWLNNMKCFLLGSHTSLVAEIMKTQDPSEYYSSTYSSDSPAKRTYQNGDFILRPSKRRPGKLVASVLLGNAPKHVVVFVRNGKLMVDGYSYNLPPSVTSLRGLVEFLLRMENCDFRQACGETVTANTPSLGSTSSHKSEAELIVELTSRLESLNLTVSEVRAWNGNDIDELLKTTLQIDVIKRNKMKDALKKLSSSSAAVTAMSDSLLGSDTWDGMVQSATVTSSKPLYTIRCTDKLGVAYRSQPVMSSVISPNQGVKHMDSVDIITEEGQFYRTVDNKYLPKQIDNEDVFERVDHIPRQLSSSSTAALPPSIELDSSTTTPTKIQISYKDKLGSGSFGSVYMAMDTNSGGQRAVKMLDIREVDQKELQKVLREMELMRNLKHENVVRFYGSMLTREYMFLVMELMGQTLQQLIGRYGNLANLVRKYGAQVILGLQYMHSRDVVHRDIKPSNILVDDSGTAKLSDFGSSKVSGDVQGVGATATATAKLVGTPMYMAPEIIRAKMGADKVPQNKNPKQADIWSLGLTLLEMHTGKKPWEETDAFVLMYSISSNESLLPSIPTDICDGLRSVLEKCVSRVPDNRADINELAKHPFFNS